jgi:hypothetical protein
MGKYWNKLPILPASEINIVETKTFIIKAITITSIPVTDVTWLPELTPGSIRGYVIKVDNLDKEIK